MIRRLWLGLAIALAVPCLPGAIPVAHAVDVSQLSDFESDPCVQALVNRNSGTGLRSRKDFAANKHVDAPDSALADACERAHGNPEVAWDFLTRLWVPREVTAAEIYGADATLTPVSAGLAVVEMVLVYLVLGRPVWSLLCALQPGRGQGPRRLAIEAGCVVLARLGVGSALLILVSVPGFTLLASLLILAAMLRLGMARGQVPATTVETAPPVSGFAQVLAGVINDTAAAASGLAALALVARGHWRLLALGVLLSVLFALPPLARGWMGLRRARMGFAAAGVLLGMAAGSLLLSDAALSSAVRFGGGALGYGFPVLFGMLVLWPLLKGRGWSAR